MSVEGIISLENCYHDGALIFARLGQQQMTATDKVNCCKKRLLTSNKDLITAMSTNDYYLFTEVAFAAEVIGEEVIDYAISKKNYEQLNFLIICGAKLFNNQFKLLYESVKGNLMENKIFNPN